MKRAAADDARRRVHLRSAKNCPIFERITIRDAAGFSDISFEPKSGMFAICGATGVGKSSLLELIELALRPLEQGKRPSLRSRFGNPCIELEIKLSESKFTRKIDTNKLAIRAHGGYVPEHRLVTLAERTENLQSIFEETDPAIAIEGNQPRSLSRADLRLVSRIVGKEFSEILCYEVEDPDFPDEIVPYFLVRENGVQYDLTGMGAGELSTIYLIWILGYIAPWSILLIEEPEALLPPASHLKMFDALCAKATQNNLAIALATHSPDIVAAIPIDQILPLNRSAGVTNCATNVDRKNDVLYRLGLQPPKSGMILVEDRLALLISNEIISRYDANLHKRLEIKNIMSGFGAIKAVLDNCPSFESMRIIGLLDGDMVSTARNWASNHLCCFLPFKNCMETEFIEAIQQDISRFSRAVGRDTYRVEAALQKAVGLDPHDGYDEFCREAGLSKDVCANMAFAHWLNIRKSDELCIALVAQIRTMLAIG